MKLKESIMRSKSCGYFKSVTLFFIIISIFLLMTKSSSSQEEKSYYYNVINYCTKQLKEDSQNQYFYATRGIAKYHLADYGEAINDLDTALTIYSQSTKEGTKIKLDYSKLGDDLTNEDIFKNGEVYFYRGSAHYNIGNTQKALKDFKRTIEINPYHEKAFLNIGIINLRKEEFESAIHFFNKAIEINQDYKLAYLNRGYCYYKLGKLNLSLNEFNNALKLDSSSVTSYRYKGLIFIEKGDTIEGCRNFKLARENGGEVREYLEKYCKRP